MHHLKNFVTKLRRVHHNRSRKNSYRSCFKTSLRLETLEDRRLLALVASWSAEDTAVDPVNANNGTLFNGASYVTGQLGKAFSFDGVNDRLNVADSSSLKLTQSLTIEGWIKANQTPTLQHGIILFRGDDRGGLDPYFLTLHPGGMLQFGISGQTESASVTTPFPIGQFVHIAATLDHSSGDSSGVMAIYLNGTLVSQTTTSVRPFGDLDPNSNPGIGIGSHGGYPTTPHNFLFNGLIDELKVYSHALTASEVLANFNAGKGDLLPSILIDDAQVTEGDVRFSNSLGALVPQSDNGGLTRSTGMAYGPDGNLYVGSFSTGEVLRYSATTGGFLGRFVTSGSGGLSTPAVDGLIFGADGKLYVASRDTANVLRFNATTGAFIDEFITAGSGGLSQVKGMTFGPDGNLYITSSGTNQILRYSGATGAYLGVFVAAGTGLDGNNARSLEFGPDGQLYVSNSSSHSVMRYNGSTGALIDTFITANSGGLLSPADLLFDDGNLYVASQGTNQVLRFDASTGTFLDVVDPTNSGRLDRPIGLLLGQDGTLLVGSFGQVVRFAKSSDAVITVRLSTPWPEAVSVNYVTENGTALSGSDYASATGTITFSPGQFKQSLRVPTLDDTQLEGTEFLYVNLSNPVGGTIVDGQGFVSIFDNETPPTLFYDSFEVGEWNNLWVEDSQNDWFRSTQRATVGSQSAEVDGLATNATLTTTHSIDLSGMGQATLSFDWLIENGFDAGEYLALDISTNAGATWIQDVRRLNGNVSQEDVWHSESVDLTPYATASLKIRFRSMVSGSTEDANVDNVRIVGFPLGPNTLPVANAGGPYIVSEGSSIQLTGSGSGDPDGSITGYAWDLDSDGQYDDGTGVTPTFSTTQSGSRVIGLQVTDNRGGTSTATASVTIENVAPTANAGINQNGTVGIPFSLSAAASSDPGNDILSYAWDLDNDGQYDDATGVYTQFTAGMAGTYTVSVRVVDADGALSTDSTILSVISGPTTKFYVVNNGSPDRTYEYGATGTAVENYAIDSGNSSPRGVATTAAGDRVWVVDANRKVYVYDSAGALLGSWTAGSFDSTSDIQGIATDGTDIWIVDAKSDKVFRYFGAASRLSGSQTAQSFWLPWSNWQPRDIVTDGTHLWIVNDLSSSDKVFKYRISDESLVGSWTINGGGGSPTGITLDPSGASQSLWIVDKTTDRVYEYINARSLNSGSLSAASSFPLAAGNSDPEGIADPPPAVAPQVSTAQSMSTDIRLASHSLAPVPYLSSTSPALARAAEVRGDERQSLTELRVDRKNISSESITSRTRSVDNKFPVDAGPARGTLIVKPESNSVFDEALLKLLDESNL